MVKYLKVYVAQWRIMMPENLQFFKVVLAPAVQDEIRKMGSIHHLKENSSKALRQFNYVSETTTSIMTCCRENMDHIMLTQVLVPHISLFV